MKNLSTIPLVPRTCKTRFGGIIDKEVTGGIACAEPMEHRLESLWKISSDDACVALTEIGSSCKIS